MSEKIIVEGKLEPPPPGDFSGVVIPFEVTKFGGQTTIRVCEELDDVARVFVCRFIDVETSEAAEKWLAEVSLPILRNAGLEPAGECGRMRIFEFDPSLPSSADISAAQEFDPEAGYDNLTGYDLDAYYRLGLPCFVGVTEGKIVSVATMSPGYAGDEVAEIGVETAPGFEGRGYAKGCVRALALRLSCRGMRVIYIAQEDNPASISVARAAGFSERGSMLQLVCIPENHG
ncbi:MAG TPA: GNAT family N-acetyltransferase [Bacillota bacterium]|nr:GNAT family N-acetyltransferase [Clostridiales bacterium]HPT84784.1 GNAT family N-acetyltransferase [Bacillota bacterium]